jgi:PKD repeat protein
VTHVIAITTDAPFHNAGDYGYYFPYPGPTRDATVAALNARNIKVIAIKAPGASTQMDDVASATGGAVAYTSNTSQQIVEAILSALEELTFTVTPVPVGCGPLQFTFSPSSHSGVGGGESVDFTETIAVPWGTTPGTYTCQVEFQADGTVVGTQEVSIEVPSPNQPPTADPNGPYLFPVNAGPFDGTGSSDPDGDTLTYDWYWGDGSSSPDASATPSHTYAAAGIYDVCLTVTDPGGLSDTACTYAVVYDPDGGFVTGGGWIDSPYGALRLDTALPFFEGSYYELVEVPYVAWPAANVAANAAILEGCEYPHLVSITSQDEQDALYEFFDGDLQGKWYGGFQNEGETDPAAGWNWVTGEPWDYTNWAPGEPNDGYGPGTEPHLIGWLDGWAWNDEGNLGNVTGYVVEYEKCGPIGKANFGFVSKYKKGATTPTGNTEFQFHAADLNFHSSSYDWLVVTGSDYARFKGVGTINGMGEYKFMLWAGDDDPDTFRIKIWEEDEYGVETVIYDNGFDQAIGGGSIVIHTKGK